MLLIRCLALVLFGLVGKEVAITFVMVDLGLFLIVKVLRRDFVYCLPMHGWTAVLISFFMRVGMKIIVDYTCISHFRHPYMLGGAFWIASLFSSLLSLPLAILYYESKIGANETSESARLAASVLLPSALFLFLIFFRSIKSSYWETFYSTLRGVDLTINSFMNSNDDYVRSTIFTTGKAHWGMIEENVRNWVEIGWGAWVEQKPKWFTQHFQVNVPIEFIPDLEERKAARARAQKGKGRVIAPNEDAWEAETVVGDEDDDAVDSDYNYTNDNSFYTNVERSSKNYRSHGSSSIFRSGLLRSRRGEGQ